MERRLDTQDRPEMARPESGESDPLGGGQGPRGMGVGVKLG
jgi:hypothetical protein